MDARRPSGMVLGSLIAIGFGTVFIMVNSGGLDAPWPVAVRVTGALVAALLLAAVLRAGRVVPAAAPAGAGFADHRYWVIVAAEALALFGGLAVINNIIDRPAVAVAWVAVVLGAHFFGLAWVWRMPLFHTLGAVLSLLGVAGFLIDAAGGGAATVGLVSGVGSGFTLFATVLAALRRAGTPPRAPDRVPTVNHAERF